MIGFSKVMAVSTALSVVVGADYYTQAQDAGGALEAYNALDDATTIPDRFTRFIERKEETTDFPLVSFLPESTGAWKIEHWGKEPEAVLKKRNNSNALRTRMVEQVRE